MKNPHIYLFLAYLFLAFNFYALSFGPNFFSLSFLCLILMFISLFSSLYFFWKDEELYIDDEELDSLIEQRKKKYEKKEIDKNL
jgi:hypothetical protein